MKDIWTFPICLQKKKKKKRKDKYLIERLDQQIWDP